MGRVSIRFLIKRHPSLSRGWGAGICHEKWWTYWHPLIIWWRDSLATCPSWQCQNYQPACLTIHVVFIQAPHKAPWGKIHGQFCVPQKWDNFSNSGIMIRHKDFSVLLRLSDVWSFTKAEKPAHLFHTFSYYFPFPLLVCLVGLSL